LWAVALRAEDIPRAFDDLNVGMSFREVLPFRRRPLLRVDEDGVALLAPQFVSEKGGVDLLWLLTNPPGGGPEARMWTDDFSLLYERYVRPICENLGSRHVALSGGPTVMESLARYARRVRRAAEPLRMHYQPVRGPHPRADTIFQAWFQELLENPSC